MQSIIQARLQKSSEQSEVYSGGQSSPLKVTNAAKGNQRKRGKRIIETDCHLMKENSPKGESFVSWRNYLCEVVMFFSSVLISAPLISRGKPQM